MNRLLPAPLMSAALFAMWLLLNRSTSAGHLLLAATIALAMPLLTAPLRPRGGPIGRPVVLLQLILAVGVDVVRSNLAVGRRVLHSQRRMPQGSFVTVPLELRDPHALAALAVITTIVPGTVWCELASDRSAVRLHVFDLDDGPAFVNQYKTRYERPLLEIFR